ncbi:hypothetical protein W97_01500 [Coniosporium apollinis CBS 100218]|uniref:Uncharacterized protein n=1 Tax=Coniosporium apollinis (strain CBS 100218) TaxID=1168221 RepID=R7YKE2_CONA1|nr:uncharacterized protein W97_01500 [Coniosporium apollinis CBS 100218]EON62279.1 hypothetical protein W97_01500 [Coniosporium apollinis CBS 100218]
MTPNIPASIRALGIETCSRPLSLFHELRCGHIVWTPSPSTCASNCTDGSEIAQLNASRWRAWEEGGHEPPTLIFDFACPICVYWAVKRAFRDGRREAEAAEAEVYREKVEFGRFFYCRQLFEIYEAGLRNEEKSSIVERARKVEKHEWNRQFSDKRKCRAVLTSDMPAEVRAGFLDCQDDFRHAFELDEEGRVYNVETLADALGDMRVSESVLGDLTQRLIGLGVADSGTGGNAH